LQPGSRLILTIDRLAAEGEAIATAPDGRVVFVRGAAPGDEVEVTLTRVRPRSLHGFVHRRLTDGPHRVPAFCPQVERCGGCPWQGIEPTTQRAALGRHVSHLLTRAVGHPVEVVAEAVQPTVAWRTTTRIHWQNGNIGFHGARSDAVVDLNDCPVLAPPLPALLAAVRRHLGPALTGEGSLRLTAAPRATSGTVHLEVGLPDGALQALLADPACHGIVAGSRRLGTPVNVFSGVPHPAEAFVQAHPAGAAALIDIALAQVLPGPVLELYAGSGAFTVPLAQAGHAVTAVEYDGAAARSLAALVAQRRLPVTVITGDAARLPPGTFASVLLDPPRAGAAEVCTALARRTEARRPGPRRIVYVACDPATLARDVGTLTRAGWRLTLARAFEMFPQTGHVETLVVLERGTA
jgi:23S rRNA (uracil1939-C5)-methyltransferase